MGIRSWMSKSMGKPRKGAPHGAKHTGEPSPPDPANDLAAEMKARAIADIVVQALSRAKTYEELNTKTGDAAAEALRKFAGSLTK
jgi:hypothetical protein